VGRIDFHPYTRACVGRYVAGQACKGEKACCHTIYQYIHSAQALMAVQEKKAHFGSSRTVLWADSICGSLVGDGIFATIKRRSFMDNRGNAHEYESFRKCGTNKRIEAEAKNIPRSG